MAYISPLLIKAYIVNGPQSAFPFPKVNDVTSRSVSSNATYAPRLFSGTNSVVFRGSSGSKDTSYSLSFPSKVMMSRVEPASPQGCQSIFAIGDIESV